MAMFINGEYRPYRSVHIILDQKLEWTRKLLATEVLIGEWAASAGPTARTVHVSPGCVVRGCLRYTSMLVSTLTGLRQSFSTYSIRLILHRNGRD